VIKLIGFYVFEYSPTINFEINKNVFTDLICSNSVTGY